MKPHIQAGRSLAAEFVSSFVRPVFFVVAGVYIAIALLTWWLASTLSEWWWLLLIPVTIVAAIIGIILLIAHLLTRLIRPNLTKLQRTAIRDFMQKAQGLNDLAHTPYPLVVVRVVIDFIMHRDGRYLRGIIADSRSLQAEYRQIIGYFGPK